jgi:type I restriction enzyme S subunit
MTNKAEPPWPRAGLLEVADLVRGVSYKRDEARGEPGLGLVPVLRANNINGAALNFADLIYVPERRVSQEQRIRRGDILLAMSSGSRDVVGKAALARTDWPGGFGAFCGVLRVRPGIDARYVAKFLQSADYRQQVDSIATGTNINNLSKTTLKSIELPLAPNEVQTPLSALLDAIEQKRSGGVAHVFAAKRAVDRFRQAVLGGACSGRVTEDWREASPEQQAMSEVLRDTERTLSTKRRRAITEFDASGLAELPSTWTWAPLAAVSDSVLGKMLDKTKNKGEPRPYLRNTNVRWRGFDLDDVSEMRFEPGEEERYGLEPGDVLVCEGGEPGRAAVWRDGESGMRFQKALHRVRCEEALLPDFLVNVLQAHASSGMLAGYFTGSGIAHLTGVSLLRVPVPLPPIEEQREIVCRVDQLLALADSLKQRIEAGSKRVERSSQAVLAKAFRGDLITHAGQP